MNTENQDWSEIEARAVLRRVLSTPLTKGEREFLKLDHGFDRIIQRADGEIHAVKNGNEVFVGWNADDVRRMNPGMSRRWK